MQRAEIIHSVCKMIYLIMRSEAALPIVATNVSFLGYNHIDTWLRDERQSRNKKALGEKCNANDIGDKSTRENV